MAFHEHYEMDPKTGYLTIKRGSRVKNGVTAEQKVTFLEAFRKSGNSGKAAKVAGFDRSTLQDHIRGDEKFKFAYKGVVEEICDDMEESLIALAHRNPTAAFGVLRAYRGHVWKDNYKEPGPVKSERLKTLLEDAQAVEDKNKE